MTREQLEEIKQIYEELAEEYKLKKDFKMAFKFKDEVRFIENYIKQHFSK